MKNYLFLTPSISVLGGAELYSLRRAKYLQNKGYRIIFISGEKESKNFLPNFKKYEKINIQELTLYYSGKNSMLFKRLLDEVENLNLKGEIYFESHNINYFLWGESLSSVLKAKHIFYILAEFNLDNYKYYHSYLKEGLYNGKLIGLSNQSLKICFPKEQDISHYQNYVNISFQNSELDLYSKNKKIYDIFDQRVDFRILTVSRLEKTYVEDLIYESIKLAKNHSSFKIELVVIGDTKDGVEKKRLIKEFNSFCNFSIHFLGHINPLSKDIFNKSDIFVGMGTSAINAISQRCPTIIIDPRNNLSPGYFGDELSNFAFSEDGRYISLLKLMKRGFLDRNYLVKLSLKSEEIFRREFDFEESMKKLDQYLSESKGNIVVNRPSFKHRFLSFIWNNSLLKYYQKLNKLVGKKKFLEI